MKIINVLKEFGCHRGQSYVVHIVYADYIRSLSP